MVEKNELNKQLTTTVNQTSLIFISKFIGFLLVFIFNLFFARLFGAELLGKYSLINTTINIIVIFSLFGFNNGLTKYISRYNKLNEYNKMINIIKTAIGYVLITSLIISIVFFFSRNLLANEIYNNSDLSYPLGLSTILIVLYTLQRFLGGIYRGFKKIKYYIFGSEVLLRMSHIIVLIIIYYFFKPDIIYILTGLIISHILLIVYILVSLKKLDLNIFLELINNKKEKLLPNEKKDFLKYSITVIFISFTGIILGRIDRVMLGILMNSKFVGVYEISSRISSIVVFLLTATSMIFSPIISELYSSNKINILESIYSTITKWIIILTLPLVVNVIIFSKEILMFFGEDYLIGSSTLIVLIIGQFFNLAVGSCGYILNMSGYERLELINNIVIGILNIIFNFIFIREFGLIGAAIATSFAIAINNIVKIIELKYLLNISPYNKSYFVLVYNFLFIFIISSIIINMYSNIIGFVFSVVIGIGISLIILYFFKTENDKFIINIFLKKINALIKNIKF